MKETFTRLFHNRKYLVVSLICFAFTFQARFAQGQNIVYSNNFEGLGLDFGQTTFNWQVEKQTDPVNAGNAMVLRRSSNFGNHDGQVDLINQLKCHGDGDYQLNFDIYLDAGWGRKMDYRLIDESGNTVFLGTVNNESTSADPIATGEWVSISKTVNTGTLIDDAVQAIYLRFGIYTGEAFTPDEKVYIDNIVLSTTNLSLCPPEAIGVVLDEDFGYGLGNWIPEDRKGFFSMVLSTTVGNPANSLEAFRTGASTNHGVELQIGDQLAALGDGDYTLTFDLYKSAGVDRSFSTKLEIDNSVNANFGGVDLSVLSTETWHPITLTVNTGTAISDAVSEIKLVLGTFGGTDGDPAVYYDNLKLTKDAVTWDGSWSNTVGPSATDIAKISAAYSGAGFSASDLMVEAGQDLIISSGSLDILNQVSNEGTITVESGASLLTYSSGYWSGNPPTIKRNRSVSEGLYSMVGIPVAIANGADLGVSSFIYSYNEATDGFEDATLATLMPGQGYATAADQALSFTGTPNAGDITYDATQAGNGYNLVANPYAAAISTSTFLGTNATSGTIYIWNDGGSNVEQRTQTDYLTANASGLDNAGTGTSGSSYNGYIGSMQGFFVQVTGSQTITFTEAMRDAGNNADANYFRKSESNAPSHVKLTLTAADGARKITTVGWADDANDNGINLFYDSKAFDPQASLLLYTLKDASRLAIQGITNSKEEIALGVNLPESGQYTISIDFNSDKKGLYLRDNVTGVLTDLVSNGYSFSGAKGEFSDRFTLLTSESKVLTIKQNLNDVYVSDNILFVSRDAASNFKIFNLSGRIIKEVSTSGREQVELRGMQSGVYIITDGILSRKFILK